MFTVLGQQSQSNTNSTMQKLEAILFISQDPLNVEDLTHSLNESSEVIEQGLEHLKSRLSQADSAIELREVSDGFQLFTKKDYYEVCEGFLLDQDKRKLSGSAIEVLSIVAYTQPVTRAQVAEIRGVNSDSLVTTLINKGYVFESGVSSEAGNPSLLSTTTKFLNSFGLKSIDELPSLEDFAPDEEARLAIAERLGALNARNSERENGD